MASEKAAFIQVHALLVLKSSYTTPVHCTTHYIKLIVWWLKKTKRQSVEAVLFSRILVILPKQSVQTMYVRSFIVLTNEKHSRPLSQSECTGAPLTHRRPTSLLSANIRIMTHVTTNSHHPTSAVRKYLHKPARIQRSPIACTII